jgi:hypothetical protein
MQRLLSFPDMAMCGFSAGCPAGESISPLLTTGY